MPYCVAILIGNLSHDSMALTSKNAQKTFVLNSCSVMNAYLLYVLNAQHTSGWSWEPVRAPRTGPGISLAGPLLFRHLGPWSNRAPTGRRPQRSPKDIHKIIYPKYKKSNFVTSPMKSPLSLPPPPPPSSTSGSLWTSCQKNQTINIG